MTDHSKLKILISFDGNYWFATAKCGDEKVTEHGPNFDQVWENIKYAISDQWCFGEDHPYEQDFEDEEDEEGDCYL